jgi:V8-like Glu-specific endopeptidase
VFQCRVKWVASDADIASLEILGRGIRFQRVVYDTNATPQVNDIVDVIGYPGNYDERWLENQHKHIIDDTDNLMTVATDILPKWRLSVTCGPFLEIGVEGTYHLSTCGGMSGGPVVYNGKVIGIYICKRSLTS